VLEPERMSLEKTVVASEEFSRGGFLNASVFVEGQ